MQFREVFKRSITIDRQVRVKLKHFVYFKGEIAPVANLGCPIMHDGYLQDKLGSLSFLSKVSIYLIW